MKKICLVLAAGLLACLGWAQSPASLDRFNVEIQTVDDYDVTTGQSVSIDPNGFDVKVAVTRLGAPAPHEDGQTFGASDQAALSSAAIHYEAILPDGEDVPLTTVGEPSSQGIAYTHLRLDPASLTRFDAISNPEISVLATLTSRSGGSAAATSRPVRLGLKISALRSGDTVVPYTYRKVEDMALKPVFATPQTMRTDEAYLGGKAPSVPGNLPYYLWLRYTVAGSAVSHFVPVAPPVSGSWRADLGYLKPDTYRLVAFASPHSDTSTFAADGWRADAYAISPEVTETIVPAGFHLSAGWISAILALLFLAAAMLTLRNPQSSETSVSEGDPHVKRAPSFTARAHRALAWVLLAIATVTIVNYYEFFTTIVATALRGDTIIGQDWNLQNSGGISLLIMSYSISLGLCIELGLYKLITLWRERQHYGAVGVLLALIWLAAITLAAWCAFAFIIHIGEFYNTQPALRELGHLAGAAELVIFFCAIGGLMPMEHESAAPIPPPPVGSAKAPWGQRIKRLFVKPKASDTAVVMMEPKGVQEPTVL